MNNEYDDDEPSIVAETNTPGRLLFKIGRMLEKQGLLVDQIPSIDAKITIVSSKQEVLDDRLERLEKNGHPCHNQQIIENLQTVAVDSVKGIQEGVKTRQMVRSLAESTAKVEKEVVEFRNARIKALIAAIMGFIGIIGTVGGTSYCLGNSLGAVRSDLTAEKTMRVEQHKAVKSRLDQLPTKDQLPSRKQVEALRTEVANGDEFKVRCSQLTDEQKTRLARNVRRGELPVTFLCP
jgi:hypothetical protein